MLDRLQEALNFIIRCLHVANGGLEFREQASHFSEIVLRRVLLGDVATAGLSDVDSATIDIDRRESRY